MLFWVTAALADRLARCLAVLVPLARRRRTPSEPAAHDLEVYRDQLAELDRDAARGLIGAAEAEEARAEIGRRILKIASEHAAGKPAAARFARARARLPSRPCCRCRW